MRRVGVAATDGRRDDAGAGTVLAVAMIGLLVTVTVVEVRYRGADVHLVRTVPIPAGGVLGQLIASALGAKQPGDLIEFGLYSLHRLLDIQNCRSQSETNGRDL